MTWLDFVLNPESGRVLEQSRLIAAYFIPVFLLSSPRLARQVRVRLITLVMRNPRQALFALAIMRQRFEIRFWALGDWQRISNELAS